MTQLEIYSIVIYSKKLKCVAETTTDVPHDNAHSIVQNKTNTYAFNIYLPIRYVHLLHVSNVNNCIRIFKCACIHPICI
jgi:hypothetical protein